MTNNIHLYKNDLPDDLKLGNKIAVDGEFMGLNVRRDPLCLVQISSGNSDAHIVQFDRDNYNAPNLVKILKDENVTKIFHYGRADMSHIKYYLKTETNNILDTKIASKLARSYSDSHSLKTLIKEFANKDVSKQFQNSDFGGELTPEQLKYCANDVIYLHKIHNNLENILKRENRIQLYKNCLKFLKTRVDLDLALFKDDIWSH
jgi:ribonuclease D|tara:strand:- start:4297 stop:4908 length:612 start_codon:yes stop_codon:yes gene_type:complete